MEGGRIILISLLVLLALAATARAVITINIVDDFGAYAAGRPFSGELAIVYDTLIENTSFLVSYIDSKAVSSISMTKYLEATEFYEYEDQIFDYNLTRKGTSTWTERPSVTFSYVITASGTRGSPPEPWSIDSGLSTSSVSSRDGLKFIKDSRSIITPPGDNNNDTLWSVSDTSNEVETTMRQACGGQVYATIPVDTDGWVRRTLQAAELEGIPGTSDCEANIEPFDSDSLTEPGRRLFVGRECQGALCGGIYKDTGTGSVYQNSPSQAEWDGSTGHIVIHSCDKDLLYSITYLTPNGPLVCAYTGFKQQNSSGWQVNAVQPNNRVDYKTPFAKTYTPAMLEALVPAPSCPAGTTDCIKSTTEFGSVKTRDPSNSVTVMFNKNTNTTTATTASAKLTSPYSALIDFREIPNLKAPTGLGPHNMSFEIKSGQTVAAGNSSSFVVCLDIDKDGYCSQAGDCNDNNPSLNAGARELCNYKDDNCNNQTDETFQEPGKLPGSQCPFRTDSACAGIFVCSSDGLSVVCNSPNKPGDLKEVCDDRIDNDCDGVVDELAELGVQGPACGCRNGETRPCGGIGGCSGGYRICANYEWSECINSTQSAQEVCNNNDDNCDGIIDNIGAGFGNSASTDLACGCSLGKLPGPESCNDIDDNCNGLIDEGISCCRTGETRSCGQYVGLCTQGNQVCANGQWGACSGTGPDERGDICGDHLDNDCDIAVDEDCDSCSNGIQNTDEDGIDCGSHCARLCGDFSVWISFAVIGIIIIAIVGILAWRSRL